MDGHGRVSRHGIGGRSAVASLPLLLMGCQGLAPTATTTHAAAVSAVRSVWPGRAPSAGVAASDNAAVKAVSPSPPLSPFSDAPVSFLIHGEFSRGEFVIVRVCLRADRSIESAAVVESSGDARFDQLAIDWARRVPLRGAIPQGARVAACGPVRVELHNVNEPPVIPGSVNLLG